MAGDSGFGGWINTAASFVSWKDDKKKRAAKNLDQDIGIWQRQGRLPRELRGDKLRAWYRDFGLSPRGTYAKGVSGEQAPTPREQRETVGEERAESIPFENIEERLDQIAIEIARQRAIGSASAKQKVIELEAEQRRLDQRFKSDDLAPPDASSGDLRDLNVIAGIAGREIFPAEIRRRYEKILRREADKMIPRLKRMKLPVDRYGLSRIMTKGLTRFGLAGIAAQVVTSAIEGYGKWRVRSIKESTAKLPDLQKERLKVFGGPAAVDRLFKKRQFTTRRNPPMERPQNVAKPAITPSTMGKTSVAVQSPPSPGVTEVAMPTVQKRPITTRKTSTSSSKPQATPKPSPPQWKQVAFQVQKILKQASTATQIYGALRGPVPVQAPYQMGFLSLNQSLSPSLQTNPLRSLAPSTRAARCAPCEKGTRRKRRKKTEQRKQKQRKFCVNI